MRKPIRWTFLLALLPSLIVTGAHASENPPPFQSIQLPFRDEKDALCMKNGPGLRGASGPVGWWARETGACTGMSLLVGAALANTQPADLGQERGMPLAERYALATRLARMGCTQKVLIPNPHTLFSSCDQNVAEFSDLASQEAATKVISEMSPTILDRLVNPEDDLRSKALESIKRVYRELKQGRPALLVLYSRRGHLPHTVLVTGLKAKTESGRDPAILLSAYDSEWNFYGHYQPRTSQVMIPFEADWSLPKTERMELLEHAEYGFGISLELGEQLLAFPLHDETQGAPSRDACCSIVRTHPSVFCDIERRACGIP